MTVPFDTVRILVLSIGTLWLGAVMTCRVPLLSRYNIPVAVSGGIVVAIALNLLQSFTSLELVWDLRARDTLLLVFFSSVGLSAKLRDGGDMFLRLMLLTILFLVLQNAVGALAAISVLT